MIIMIYWNIQSKLICSPFPLTILSVSYAHYTLAICSKSKRRHLDLRQLSSLLAWSIGVIHSLSSSIRRLLLCYPTHIVHALYHAYLAVFVSQKRRGQFLHWFLWLLVFANSAARSLVLRSRSWIDWKHQVMSEIVLFVRWTSLEYYTGWFSPSFSCFSYGVSELSLTSETQCRSEWKPTKHNQDKGRKDYRNHTIVIWLNINVNINININIIYFNVCVWQSTGRYWKVYLAKSSICSRLDIRHQFPMDQASWISAAWLQQYLSNPHDKNHSNYQ